MIMGYELYAIEVDGRDFDDSGEPVPGLLCRTAEKGFGSPLIWLLRDEAEQIVQDDSRENGYGGMRVVELNMAQRFPEPYLCDKCSDEKYRSLIGGVFSDRSAWEVWGTAEEHQEHDV